MASQEGSFDVKALHLLPLVVLAIFAIAGGIVGWRYGTRAIYHRDGLDEVFLRGPASSVHVARARRQRLLWTAAFALGGAAIGAGGLIYLVR